MRKATKFLSILLSLAIGFVVGFSFQSQSTYPDNHGDIYVSGNLKIHFLELGNANTGDSILIQVGNTDVLIDAGSKSSSFETIDNYLDDHVADGRLEYVIVTHAHEDHYVNFTTTVNIFTEFEVGTIIDFAMSNNVGKVMYEKYITQRNLEVEAGAIRYSAAECVKEENGAQKMYDLGNNIQLEILDSYYYYIQSSSENNYSVCVLIRQGDNNFLFTGDLEKAGEEYLVELNDLPEVELYKAGHHGSTTSSHDCLLSVIKPKIVVVCCCAGNDEYTSNTANQFPSQAFINRVAVYTDEVYVTSIGADGFTGSEEFASFNGTIVITSNKKGIKITCSNNDTKLKDTEWFKNNREMPSAWA